jgi:tRNA dimethylallyltransferase
MKNTLIALLGPTGVGKTDVAVRLALHFGTEIISADSRQFFREMKIGAATPSPEQLSRVKHHFIGFLSVKDYYSSSLFERDVLEILPRLFREHPVVIMTGGSGLYIDAVCEGIDDIPDVDPGAREKYIAKYRTEGIEGLRMALRILDPEHYSNIDLKNPKRIIRALEICETTGRPYSSFLTRGKKERDFAIAKTGLMLPRDVLYGRINARVDKMIADGLEDEAMKLYEYRNLNALNSLGYSELFDYFEGNTTRDEAIELIKRNTRRYAKRQMTWWSRQEDISWFDPGNIGKIIGHAKNLI